MGVKIAGEKVLGLLHLAASTAYTRFTDLGLDPIALQLGPVITELTDKK